MTMAVKTKGNRKTMLFCAVMSSLNSFLWLEKTVATQIFVK